MKGDADNTFVQNQYGQDQARPLQPGAVGQGYNDTDRGFGTHPQQPQGYGSVGNMGARQQPHVQGNQPIYVVDQPARSSSDNFVLDILLYVVAFFLPPASVVVKRGCGGQFWINIILTILGFLPGLIHAFYIIAVTPGTYSKAPRRH